MEAKTEEAWEQGLVTVGLSYCHELAKEEEEDKESSNKWKLALACNESNLNFLCILGLQELNERDNL